MKSGATLAIGTIGLMVVAASDIFRTGARNSEPDAGDPISPDDKAWANGVIYDAVARHGPWWVSQVHGQWPVRDVIENMLDARIFADPTQKVYLEDWLEVEDILGVDGAKSRLLGALDAYASGSLEGARGYLGHAGSGNRDGGQGALKVVSVKVHRAGFRGADVARAHMLGRVHDPRAIRSVEVFLSGSVGELRSEAARRLAVAEAAKYGISSDGGLTKSNPYRDQQGRTVARFEIQ